MNRVTVPVEVTIEKSPTRNEDGSAVSANGERFVFNDDSCAARLDLSVGARCVVILYWPGAKEHRALLVRSTPGAFHDELILARQQADRCAWDETSKFVPTKGLAPIDLVRPHLPVPEVVSGWLGAAGRKRVASRVPELDFGGLSLFDFWQIDTFDPPTASFDPCYVPFGGADGDTLGLYFYPPAVERGVVPVLFGFHEEDPPYTWVAPSADAFEATLAAEQKPTGKAKGKARGKLKGKPDGKERWDAEVATAIAALAKAPSCAKKPVARERYLVWKLNQTGIGGAPEELVGELRAVYRELGWLGALAMLDEARRVTPRGKPDKADVEKRITDVLAPQLATVEVLERYKRLT